MPLLVAAQRFVVVAGFELPPRGVNQHLSAAYHRSLQHARCSSGALIGWGRVHEVRRPSMPKLGALILFSYLSLLPLGFAGRIACPGRSLS